MHDDLAGKHGHLFGRLFHAVVDPCERERHIARYDERAEVVEHLGVVRIVIREEVIQEFVAQDVADAVGKGDVAVFAEQHVTQIRILLDELVQLHQVRVGLALGVFRIVPAADDRQPVRQLVLEAGQQVVHILIVNIEGAAVDVCNRCQFAHGNVLDAFFRHELHQSKPKLPFRLSHSAVYNFFFHSPIPPTCFLLS